MKYDVTEGVQSAPIKAVIYGPEGIGKSTLASSFPGALFIDTEGGTARLNVRRFPRPADWDQLLDMVGEVASSHVCHTLVIDTADWAERMASAKVCKKYNKTGIEDFGYGKGYVYVKEEFDGLFKSLERVSHGGANVVLVAHAAMRKFEQPDQLGAYDRWEMKLSKHVAPLVKEWADLLLFCNYKTFVMSGNDGSGKGKAQGGKRVMYATHHPCWDAKNRFGLPDEMDMAWEPLGQALFPGRSEQKPSANRQRELALRVHVMAAAAAIDIGWVQKAVASQGYVDASAPVESYPLQLLESTVIPKWDAVLQVAKEMRADAEGTPIL